jgi:phenylalanyl-tRNA synthetase beta chain
VEAKFLRTRIGEPLSIEQLSAPLRRLGFGVQARGEHLTVTVPTWRNTGDISGPHDLVEEIARLYGYERFKFQPPLIQLNATARQFARGTERRLKEFLASSCGMQEVVTYPWPDESDVAAIGGDAGRTALRLHAPPAPEQGTVRTSLLPGLLKSIRVNLRWHSSFRIFEAGRVFTGTEFASLDDEREKLPKESRRLAAALVGDDAAGLFRSAKGVVEQLSRRVHIGPLRLEAGAVPSWADHGACLTIASETGVAGQVGILNLRATQAAGLKRALVAIIDLDLDRLVGIPSRQNQFRQLPRLPGIDIDVTMVYANAVRWETIAGTVSAVNPLVAEVHFLDEYRGKDIPKGHRALSLRARLQHESRTLAMDEAAAVGQAIRDSLQRTLNATAR